MKKKHYLGIVFVGLIIVGGIGLMLFKKNESERKEQEVVRMETITAKQIKNTFADVTEIRFSEGYVENSLAGFIGVNVTIVTDMGSSEIGVNLPSEKGETLLDFSYSGELIKKGKTDAKVKVTFSNNFERSF